MACCTLGNNVGMVPCHQTLYVYWSLETEHGFLPACRPMTTNAPRLMGLSRNISFDGVFKTPQWLTEQAGLRERETCLASPSSAGGSQKLRILSALHSSQIQSPQQQFRRNEQPGNFLEAALETRCRAALITTTTHGFLM